MEEYPARYFATNKSKSTLSLRSKYSSKKLSLKSQEAPVYSYFEVVQKVRDKEAERIASQNRKCGFVERYYQKLKAEMQENSGNSKKLHENINLMNICLRQRHTRNRSENLRKSSQNTIQNPKHSKRCQIVTESSTPRTSSVFNSFYEERTKQIMSSCQKQNWDLNSVHQKVKLLNYYRRKVDKKFDMSSTKIRKYVRDY